MKFTCLVAVVHPDSFYRDLSGLGKIVSKFQKNFFGHRLTQTKTSLGINYFIDFICRLIAILQKKGIRKNLFPLKIV